MKYYAKYTFKRSEYNPLAYILSSVWGKQTLNLFQYSHTPQNGEKGIADAYYIKLSVPRNPRIRRFFAFTIEVKDGVLTSIEPLNDKNRTFGDAKNIYENAILLIQFSEDLKQMDIYFVAALAVNKEIKQKMFSEWNEEENLELDLNMAI